MRKKTDQHGFTLVEMAMVIGIIALIMAGVLASRDLIRNAEIKGIMSEVASYRQSIMDFRDKYQALPGDFAGATALWGAADNTPASCWVTIGTGTQTCDGDGDGRVTTQAADTTATQYEQYRAWQHLANAHMIDRTYNGVAGSADPQDAVVGQNVPASSMRGGGYSLISMTSDESAGSTHYYSLNYGHMLQFGADLGSTVPSSLIAPVLSTSEALSIDQKIDDGYPGSGSVIAPKMTSPYSPSCTNSDTADTARYDATQSGAKCSLLFLLGF